MWHPSYVFHMRGARGTLAGGAARLTVTEDAVATNGAGSRIVEVTLPNGATALVRAVRHIEPRLHVRLMREATATHRTWQHGNLDAVTVPRCHRVR